MSACTRTSCGGSIAADGYCNTCGYAGTPPSTPPAPAPPTPAAARPAPPPPPAGRSVPRSAPQHIHAPAASSATGPSCNERGCGGTVAADGYCDTCGMQPSVAPAPAPAPAHAHSAQGSRVPVAAGSSCTEAGCGGTVAADGYCDTCGLQPTVAAPTASPAGTAGTAATFAHMSICLLYTSPSPRDQRGSRMPSSA